MRFEMKPLLFLFLLCGMAFGADQTFYVWPDAPGPTHDGSTWDYAYTSCQAFENAQDTNITGIGNYLVQMKCTTNPDTTLSISGWTMDSTHKVKFISSDHSYRFVSTNADIITISENACNVEFTGITFQLSAQDGDGDDLIYINGQDAGSTVDFIGCTFIGTNDSDNYQKGILSPDADCALTVYNCVFYNFYALNSTSQSLISAVGVTKVYNSTFIGGYYGVKIGSGGTGTIKNVLCYGQHASGSAWYDDTATTTAIHCMASIGGSFDTETNCFESAAGISLTETGRLNAGSNGIDDGIDLSGDTPAVTDDIDGDARSGTYDIGCDEYVSTGYLLLRRRHQ